MANLQIRVDDALKAQAHAVSADLGMDVATAVRIFLAQMVREKALPFTPSLDPFHSSQNQAHLVRLAHEMTAPAARFQGARVMNREEWLREAVHTGLQALENKDFAQDEHIKDIFAKAGANVG